MINTRGEENLYLKLTSMDIITPARVLLEKQGFRISGDGKWRRPSAHAWNTPWVHQHRDLTVDAECELWNDIFFNTTNMIPSYCQNCYKVVVSIPTIEQLFDFYELQKELEHPCKCGIEYRATDERKYGGYFYNTGVEQGQETYHKVKRAVHANISPEIDIKLKCACTEYEIAHGPPAEWVVTEKQAELEKMFKKWVIPSDIRYEQPPYIIAWVMLRWLHHASLTGDMTYKKFTGGVSLVKTMKTYHEEKDNG